MLSDDQTIYKEAKVIWQNQHGRGEASLSTVVTTNYSYRRQVPQQTSTVTLLTMPIMTGEKDGKWQLSSKVFGGK